MANQEQLDRLFKEGVQAWNQWRSENPDVKIDLRGAFLFRVNLSEVNFRDSDLSFVNLSEANLSKANLSNARLFHADLSFTVLIYANLSGAKIHHTNLSYTDLRGVNLHHANIMYSVFGDNNLSAVKGLETVEQQFGPSNIGIDTIYDSQGKIPEAFLKGAGVPDSFIEYMRSLVGSPFDYYSCFISYSSKDQAFAERIYADLQSKGVRCWFAPKDIKIGDKFRSRIDEAIRMYDKLLLVLSEHSIRSPWVEKEVEQAFEKEQKRKKLMLFPVQLDDTVNRTRQAWAADLRRVRHIGDFRQWKEHDEYQKAFARLLRDLQTTS